MAYRSQMGYINAVALPDNIYQKKINQWRMMMTLIIVVTFLIFAMSVLSLSDNLPAVENSETDGEIETALFRQWPSRISLDLTA